MSEQHIEFESKTRQATRKNILLGAKSLFILEGIHNVTMKEISKNSNISIRTLYDYYTHKEDIAIDIQINEMSKLSDNKLSIPSHISGFEEVKILLTGMYNIIMKNQMSVKFITAFDFYFYNGYPSTKYKDYLAKIASNPITNAIIKGEEDRSIHLDGMLASEVGNTIIQGLFALAQKNMYREKSYMETGRDLDRGNLEIYIKLVLKSLENKKVSI